MREVKVQRITRINELMVSLAVLSTVQRILLLNELRVFRIGQVGQDAPRLSEIGPDGLD